MKYQMMLMLFTLPLLFVACLTTQSDEIILLQPLADYTFPQF